MFGLVEDEPSPGQRVQWIEHTVTHEARELDSTEDRIFQLLIHFFSVQPMGCCSSVSYCSPGVFLPVGRSRAGAPSSAHACSFWSAALHFRIHLDPSPLLLIGLRGLGDRGGRGDGIRHGLRQVRGERAQADALSAFSLSAAGIVHLVLPSLLIVFLELFDFTKYFLNVFLGSANSIMDFRSIVDCCE